MIVRMGSVVSVADASQVASARRLGAECSAKAGLSATAAGHVGLITTELATNLVKHGGGGWIAFGDDDLGTRAVTILACDAGRGIENVPTAMRDGFSTAGSPGTGLGAVERAANSTNIYTLVGKGTVVYCVVSEDARARSPLDRPVRFSVAGLAVPKRGETENGDSWTAVMSGSALTLAVADGLGHGPLAAAASSAASRLFATSAEVPLDVLMRDTHGALRPTRGAAVGVARIQADSHRADFIGVGNIAGTIADGDSTRKTVSLPGIVGHEMRKVQSFSYPCGPSAVLVLQSDGLSAAWTQSAYPGLLQQEPAVIAAVLYRDLCRGTDDATVVVAKSN